MIHMADLEDGEYCLQCGTLAITDPGGICFDCWAENDIAMHEAELAKKNSNKLELDTSNDTEE